MQLVRESGAPAPHEQIREILRREILHKMAVDDRLPPERDLAERFGVNRATVRRALECLINEGLIERSSTRGTFVAGGDALTRSGTRAVGMVAPEMKGTFPTHLVRTAASELRNRGYKPVLFDSDNCVATEVRKLERMVEEGWQGTLVIPAAHRDNLPVLNRLAKLGYPLVVVDHIPLGLEVDYVASDHFLGAYEATTILIERGHTRIAHFAHVGTRVHTSIRDRRLGYEQALADHGIELDPELIVPPVSYGAGDFVYKHVMAYLRAGKQPVTAVFALNDYFVHASVAACRDLGLGVPDDLEIAGVYDGGLDAPFPMPPLIRVVQRQAEIGRLAVELMISRIEGTGPDGPQTVAVTPEIINELEDS